MAANYSAESEVQDILVDFELPGGTVLEDVAVNLQDTWKEVKDELCEMEGLHSPDEYSVILKESDGSVSHLKDEDQVDAVRMKLTNSALKLVPNVSLPSEYGLTVPAPLEELNINMKHAAELGMDSKVKDRRDPSSSKGSIRAP